MRIQIIIISILALFVVSCKKNKLFSKGHLEFSADTVLFDTVFTTIGSTTKRFKAYNRSNSKLLIDEIELMGGASSPFRINVDGVSGIYHEKIELPKKDSIFIFVEVTLQVNNTTNPMIISDSIRFKTNGINQYVNLDVWGQDAYFHANEITAGVWPNDKPHVLYGVVAVGYPGIDSNLTLTIPQGTQVYCHKNSRLIVYKSTLHVQGQLNNEVIFRGDRLESFYENVSGQWWGIRLIEAQSSTINYAIIKNASVALQVDSTQSPVTLTLSNTIINNSDFFNLNANAGAIIQAENCLFGNAGLYGVFLFAGGEYQFKHCHFTNYWSGGRGGPALAVKNWYKFENVNYVRTFQNSRFDNCVIYGSIENELVIDTISGVPFDCIFNYCLIKRGDIYTYANFTNIIWNQNPIFVDPTNRDWHFESSSPLNNSGTPLFSTPFDIEGVIRSFSSPDIGCYEKL